MANFDVYLLTFPVAWGPLASVTASTHHLRVALAALIALSGSTVFAQDSATLNVFSPGETPEDDFHISRPNDFGHVRFGAQLHFDYANDPLVYENMHGDADTEAHRIVGHQLTGTLGLNLGLADRLVIYAGLPLVLVQNGDDADATGAPAGVASADGFGLGDAYLGARLRIFGDADDTVALGLQATVTFPTAGEQLFRGDSFLSVHPELLFEIRPGSARINVNVGGRVRENVIAGNTDDNAEVEPGNGALTFLDALTFGLGFAVPIYTGDDPRTHLDLHAQIYGSTAFADFFSRDSTPLEAIGGLKFFHSSGLVIGAAGGPGIVRGFGSPDFRVIGMLSYMQPPELEGEPEPVAGDRDGDGISDEDDQCPDDPEDVDTFEDEDGCPDPDNDQDGILDASDECPLQPETVNDIDDEDGCPDEMGDRDGDGLLDNVDQCPDQPEDMDSFEDENGCPDPDNDNDGILDGPDQCPMEPEDRDGFEDENGCPDPDNDGDGVLDNVDNCPMEPGPERNQGCRERQRVRITGETIEILDKVYFRTNSDVIQPRSFRLLQNVATVLNNHPEIRRVRVEGHTDARGSRDHNMDLSQRRAQSVVNWLSGEGSVDGSRLVARGFGPDRPVVENARNRREHAQNRRVEFHIEGAEGNIQNGSSGAAAQGTID